MEIPVYTVSNTIAINILNSIYLLELPQFSSKKASCTALSGKHGHEISLCL